MEMGSPYASNYDNPIRYSDPLGDEGEDCCKFLWSAAGAGAAFLDNATGGVVNLRSALAPNSNDAEAVQAYNTRQDIGDAASVVVGQGESASGAALANGSLIVTGASGGLTAEVTFPTAVAGGLMAVHGQLTSARGAANLANQKDRVQATSNSSSGEGRGKNNRKPDKEATGDHTVSNDKGSTTYKKNAKNPSGFDEVKRVDTKGKSHNGVPTPMFMNQEKRLGQRNPMKYLKQI